VWRADKAGVVEIEVEAVLQNTDEKGDGVEITIMVDEEVIPGSRGLLSSTTSWAYRSYSTSSGEGVVVKRGTKIRVVVDPRETADYDSVWCTLSVRWRRNSWW